MPGTSGFGAADRGDGPVVNLSYLVLEAFPELKRLAPDADWAKVESDGKALIKQARFSDRKLPPDWLSMRARPRPAEGFPPEFGYNALRIPLYLVRAGDSDRVLLKELRDGMVGEDGKSRRSISPPAKPRTSSPRSATRPFRRWSLACSTGAISRPSSPPSCPPVTIPRRCTCWCCRSRPKSIRSAYEVAGAPACLPGLGRGDLPRLPAILGAGGRSAVVAGFAGRFRHHGKRPGAAHPAGSRGRHDPRPGRPRPVPAAPCRCRRSHRPHPPRCRQPSRRRQQARRRPARR